MRFCLLLFSFSGVGLIVLLNAYVAMIVSRLVYMSWFNVWQSKRYGWIAPIWVDLHNFRGDKVAAR